ncbi:hypothetical protein EV715DRAFT_297420 [Schizophyllum commune]
MSDSVPDLAPGAGLATSSPSPATSSPPTAPQPPTQPPPANKKRQRKYKDKGESKNKKLWARGIREEILLPHLAKFTEELAKSSKDASAYGVKVCHEFNVKIPYNLPDKDEPDLPLPQYDAQNPPPLPPLSEDEEKARSEALRVRDKRVMDWLKYRARKVLPANPKGAMDTNNPFRLYMMGLTGLSDAPKKARQGWQQYQHENPAFIQESAQQAWDEKVASGEVDPEEWEDDESVEGEQDGGKGKKATKGVGFISEHARRLFAVLPESEQKALGVRAREAKAAAQKAWDEALKAKPSRTPDAVQTARNYLPAFLSPIMDGVNQYCADAHVLILVGGREPMSSGRIKVQHYSVGKNKQGIHFPTWNSPRFRREFLGHYGEYLQTVWDEDECAAMASGAGSTSAAGDALKTATFSFDDEKADNDEQTGDDDEQTGGDDEQTSDEEEERAGDNDEDESDGEHDSSRPTKRICLQGLEVTRTSLSRDEIGDDQASDADIGGANGGGDYVPLDLPPPPTMRPRPPRRRASARTTGAPVSDYELSENGSTPQSGASLPPPPMTSTPAELAGIPIDPALLRPPYTRPLVPAVASAALAAAEPASAAQSAASSQSTSPTPLGLPASASPKAPSAMTVPVARLASLSASQVVVTLPAMPIDAPEWFSTALEHLSIDLGGEWASLLHAWLQYEGSRSYGDDRPAKTSKLDVAGCRPKEISAWIAGGRWRSSGCEPAKKEGRFALNLLNSWWKWYAKLVPEWREEDEAGRF